MDVQCDIRLFKSKTFIWTAEFNALQVKAPQGRDDDARFLSRTPFGNSRSLNRRAWYTDLKKRLLQETKFTTTPVHDDGN